MLFSSSSGLFFLINSDDYVSTKRPPEKTPGEIFTVQITRRPCHEMRLRRGHGRLILPGRPAKRPRRPGASLGPRAQRAHPSDINYISFLNIASKSAMLASLGLPGAHASAAADSHRNGRSSSLSASSLVGMPTSTESCFTASMAALR